MPGFQLGQHFKKDKVKFEHLSCGVITDLYFTLWSYNTGPFLDSSLSLANMLCVLYSHTFVILLYSCFKVLVLETDLSVL